jgi:hypothetical protein
VDFLNLLIMKKLSFESLSFQKFIPLKIEKLGIIKGGYCCATGNCSVTLIDGTTKSFSADTTTHNDQTGAETGKTYHNNDKSDCQASLKERVDITNTFV